MVRVLADGQVKRSRDEERTNADTHRHSFAHHYSRHHRHSSLSSARDPESKDHELEHQMEQLQTSLQNRLRSIRRREEACAADARLNQQRSQQLEDREDAVKEQADNVSGQQATMRQLQLELLDQYNAVVASLPGLDDRLQAARQLLPEYAIPATSSAKDVSLDAAEAGSSAAPQQPVGSLLPQEALSDQLAEAPGVAHCKFPNSNVAAEPEPSPDVNGEDARCSSRLETDSPPNAAGDMHQPSATSEIVVTAKNSGLPRTSLHEQLPTALPSEKHQGQLADASKQSSRFKSANQAEQTSLAASQQQELPPPPDQGTCAAEEVASKGADPSHHTETALRLEANSATQSAVLHSSPQPASAEQRPPQLPARQSSKEHVAAEIAIPANRNHTRSKPCTLMSGEARPKQAEAGCVQTRHQRTRQGSHQAEAEAQAAANAMVPSVMKLRTGLRSRPDSAASSDKRGMASQARAEPTHRKQAGTDSARKWPEASYSSSRGNGRGRAYGRGGRRGRGRSNLLRTSYSEPQPAGDMDEAVQALKATTESLGPGTGAGPAASRTGGANALEDDELKPSFMRRVAPDRSPPSHGRPVPTAVPVSGQAHAHLPPSQTVSQASSQDPNPRPLTRRRIDSSKTAERAKAKAIMQKEVPDLLDILQQKGWADHVDLLEYGEPATKDNVYLVMHNILSKLCEGKTGSWQGRNVTGKGMVMDGEESSVKHEYCLLALEHLLERADAYSLNSEPVRWGWCRELSSFVFVFEGANRIVVEKPVYGHATYFFDLEEPLPVSSQVQRLIAILSVPGVSRRKLLEASSLDPGHHLTQEEHKQLEAAGWKPGTTVRSLLNFTGDRIFHQSAEIMMGQKFTQRDVLDYKDKIAKVLSEGAGGGRVTKHLQ